MSQKQYFEKILTKFGMSDCNARKSPCDEGIDKEPDDSPDLGDAKAYREIVGSLIYAMTTRPDLSYVVTKLSQKMSKPSEKDLNIAKGVLRYIKGTLDHALVFKRASECAKIQGHCDADWASSIRLCISPQSGQWFHLMEEQETKCCCFV